MSLGKLDRWTCLGSYWLAWGNKKRLIGWGTTTSLSAVSYCLILFNITLGERQFNLQPKRLFNILLSSTPSPNRRTGYNHIFGYPYFCTSPYRSALPICLLWSRDCKKRGFGLEESFAQEMVLKNESRACSRKKKKKSKKKKNYNANERKKISLLLSLFPVYRNSGLYV